MKQKTKYIISIIVLVVGIAVLIEGYSFDDSVLKAMGIICIILSAINGFVASLAYAGGRKRADRMTWCMLIGEMVHGGRSRGAYGHHVVCFTR